MRQVKYSFVASVAASLMLAALVAAPGAWAASTYKILHAFRRSSGGTGLQGNLVSDAAGNLYGTTYMEACRLPAVSSSSSPTDRTEAGRSTCCTGLRAEQMDGLRSSDRLGWSLLGL
jgi:hypothetical protein